MKINGTHYQTIWVNEKNPKVVQTFDQRLFPHKLEIVDIVNSDEAAAAIKEMLVRGAPLIGVTAAYGMYLACIEAESVDNQDNFIIDVAEKLKATRPTAINLMWAVDKMLAGILKTDRTNRISESMRMAEEIKAEDIEICRLIGEHGLNIIEEISKRKKGEPVNILTHCNAGWIATIDWGTATSPIYQAQLKGIDVHVWVDETRPRNQGANLTAFELGEQGIAHTLIVDNTGGHLMQHGMVDMVIVGTDRTTYKGDVANKIGTYLKALAAKDNNVPFYVALPSSTIDWEMAEGMDIPIETRSEDEVKYIRGMVDGRIEDVLICPASSPAINFGFDVTPSRLITGLITERGICNANEEGIKSLFPEKR